MVEASKTFQEMGAEFNSSLRNFIEKTDELSKNSLKRVCKALAAHPLEEDLITLTNSNEEEVYEIGKQIQTIKLNMMVESLRQDAEEQRARDTKVSKVSVPDHIDKPEYASE